MEPTTETTQTGNVIEVNHKGSTHKFDITKPEELAKLRDLAAYGLEGPKLSQERAALKKKADDFDQWEGLIKKAGTDDETFDQVVNWLEQTTGRSLTKAQKQQVEDYIESDEMNAIKALEQKLSQVQNKLETTQKQSEAEKVLASLDKIVGNEKYPFADRDEMIEHATKLGITRWDTVYKDLYGDKIIQAEVEKEQKKTQELLNKRKAAVTESGTLGGLGSTKPKSRNIADAGRLALEELAAKGASLIR